jgi:hypothetical protein
MNLWGPVPWPYAMGTVGGIGALYALFQIVALLRLILLETKDARTQLHMLLGTMQSIREDIEVLQARTDPPFRVSEPD